MKKAEKILEYTVVFEPAQEGGYIVHVPALPGCHSQGDTKIQARQNIIEAIELYLEDQQKHGEFITQEQEDLIDRVKVRV